MRVDLLSLIGAIDVDSPLLFEEHLRWSKLLAARDGRNTDRLHRSYHSLLAAAEQLLSATIVARMKEYVATGFAAIEDREISEDVEEIDQETTLDPTAPHARLAREYLALLLDGDRRSASELILGVVSAGLSIREVYLQIFGPIQREIGHLWQSGRLTVAQEHFCTAATQSIMSQLYPQLLSMERRKGKIVALSVSGELHEIGLRMVTDLLEMEGWSTYYLGTNTPSTAICEVVIDQEADLVAISATMTYHLHHVREAIEIIRRNSSCADLPILVGGYPFNVDTNLWKRLGADGYASDVTDIGALANRLVGS